MFQVRSAAGAEEQIPHTDVTVGPHLVVTLIFQVVTDSESQSVTTMFLPGSHMWRSSRKMNQKINHDNFSSFDGPAVCFDCSILHFGVSYSAKNRKPLHRFFFTFLKDGLTRRLVKQIESELNCERRNK